MKLTIIFMFIFFSSMGCTIPLEKPIEGKVLAVGHRGARAIYPENSLPGFDYALETGVDALELDVVVTKDNMVVVNHDAEINAQLCLGPQGQELGEHGPVVWQLTLKEVQSYQCGLKPHPKFPQQKKMLVRIPILKELFAQIKKSKYPAAKNVAFHIEIKSEADRPQDFPPVEEFVERVLKVIDDAQMTSRVFILSFDFRIIKRVKEIRPEIPTTALVEDAWLNPLRVIEDTRANVYSPNYQLINYRNVKDLHKMGVRVNPWTVNERKYWKNLLSMGVDALVTDDPAALIEYLKENGRG
jgi:glycerophosphoryl diester phosphodiesterase